METFKLRHCGPRNYPRLWLELLPDRSWLQQKEDILAPQNLPNVGPGGVGFPHLDTDRLNVIAVLGHEAPKALEDFNPLPKAALNQELLPKSQCQ